MTERVTAALSDLKIIRAHRGWFIFLGIVLLVAGIAAVAFPFVTTIAAKLFLGWLFLIGGVAQVVHAFSARQWGGFFWSLLAGFLYLVAGAWLAFLPFTGIISLTVLLAALFIGQGIVEVVIGSRSGVGQGRVWMIVSGIVAVIVGLLIFSGLPSTATWAIGMLVGINMLFSGTAFLSLAMAVGGKTA